MSTIYIIMNVDKSFSVKEFQVGPVVRCSWLSIIYPQDYVGQENACSLAIATCQRRQHRVLDIFKSWKGSLEALNFAGLHIIG